SVDELEHTSARTSSSGAYTEFYSEVIRAGARQLCRSSAVYIIITSGCLLEICVQVYGCSLVDGRCRRMDGRTSAPEGRNGSIRAPPVDKKRPALQKESRPACRYAEQPDQLSDRTCFSSELL